VCLGNANSNAGLTGQPQCHDVRSEADRPCLWLTCGRWRGHYVNEVHALLIYRRRGERQRSCL